MCELRDIIIEQIFNENLKKIVETKEPPKIENNKSYKSPQILKATAGSTSINFFQ